MNSHIDTDASTSICHCGILILYLSFYLNFVSLSLCLTIEYELFLCKLSKLFYLQSIAFVLVDFFFFLVEFYVNSGWHFGWIMTLLLLLLLAQLTLLMVKLKV